MKHRDKHYDQCSTDGCNNPATSLEHTVCINCYGIIRRMMDKDKKALNKRAMQLQRSHGCLRYFSTAVTGSKSISLPVWPGQVRAKNPRKRARYA